jgi:hypothetical protein
MEPLEAGGNHPHGYLWKKEQVMEPLNPHPPLPNPDTREVWLLTKELAMEAARSLRKLLGTSFLLLTTLALFPITLLIDLLRLTRRILPRKRSALFLPLLIFGIVLLILLLL